MTNERLTAILFNDLQDDEIVVFNKAYIKFGFLHDLTKRGVFWVSRAKDNMLYKTVGQHSYQFDWEADQIRRGCLDWVLNDEDEFETGYY